MICIYYLRTTATTFRIKLKLDIYYHLQAIKDRINSAEKLGKGRSIGCDNLDTKAYIYSTINPTIATIISNSALIWS